jgi:hypothetical protein
LLLDDLNPEKYDEQTIRKRLLEQNRLLMQLEGDKDHLLQVYSQG